MELNAENIDKLCMMYSFDNFAIGRKGHDFKALPEFIQGLVMRAQNPGVIFFWKTENLDKKCSGEKI